MLAICTTVCAGYLKQVSRSLMIIKVLVTLSQHLRLSYVRWLLNRALQSIYVQRNENEQECVFFWLFVTASHSGSYKNLEFCHLLADGGNKNFFFISSDSN
jgi:DNA integrity scanning protein DisA with diadenylate cyclase activity